MHVWNAFEKYDGKGDARAWLNTFIEMADFGGLTEEVTLKVARLHLKEAAQKWSQQRQFDSWADFEEQFISRFGETTETAVARLERCSQLPGESPKSFADRFLEDAERAGRVPDAALLFQFIQKLQPDLKIEVV